MKRLIYISILSILLLSGCSKPSPAPAPAPEQYARYIFFSSGIETKAQLIESQNGSDMGAFGVVGFKYDFGTDWETYSTTTVDGQLPTPNVFYEESPDTQIYELTNVETVRVSEDGTRAEYSPLQGWSNTKKYAFFAYYPIGNSAVTLVNTAGSEYKGGVPAIRYTMDPTSGEAFRTSMEDVMTAPAQIDKFWKSSAEGGNNVANGEVNFTFEHRLSCLGLNLKNSTAGGITVNSVTFHLRGIQYQSITIPLDGSTRTSEGPAVDIDCALQVGDGGIAVPSVSTDSKGVEVPDKLILIPQASNLTLSVTVGYTRTLASYESNSTSFTTAFLSTALTEGQKHIVYLNFTDSTVDVEMKLGKWVDIPTVEDTFN